MITYLSTADIAAWFGVQVPTVEKWRKRYNNFPEPDAMIGTTAGWLPARWAELCAWETSRPGPGAGGGRPRATPTE